MTLLWTKSKLPTGAAITWMLDEPCSHFAILFANSIVLHSNFSGVHVERLADFSKQCHIIYKKEYDIPFIGESALFLKILRNYFGKRYDWKWFFSLLYYAFLNKVFDRAIPANIKWQSRYRFLCTEMAPLLSPVIGPVDIGYGSPYLLAVKLGVTT